MELQRGEDGELTPESDLMFGVSGSFAAYHKAKIKADTMRGARAAALKGNQTRRKAPYGYYIPTKADVMAGSYRLEELGKYLIVESEARFVREIFERRAAGTSIVNIARWLDEEGVKTRQNLPFPVQSLARMLSNTVYIGKGTYGRTRRVNDESRLGQGYKTDFTLAKRPSDDVIYIPAPPIVEESVFEACHKLRQMPRNANMTLGAIRAPDFCCPAFCAVIVVVAR